MQKRSASLILALLCTVAPAVMAASSAEARAWIERMNKAVVHRNYEGVLEHRWGRDGHEVLRIIHRMQDGHMAERLVFFGSNNEVIRDGSTYWEYDRRKRVAKVQTFNRSYGYISAFNGISAESDKLYDIRDGGTQVLKDYPGPVQFITVAPRDGLRYGYRFWLDRQSAMPIKTQLVATNGMVLDEILFQSLSLPQTIDDERLKPAMDVKSFKWMRPADAQTLVKQAFLPRANLLPDGFRVLDTPADKADAKGPRSRFIVSDGIAWVSVFVTVADKLQETGRKEAAGTNTYVRRQDGYDITVVGEVPSATVERIAAAVLPE
jgi:sigma-E factor negative regulatory protein RseB